MSINHVSTSDFTTNVFFMIDK